MQNLPRALLGAYSNSEPHWKTLGSLVSNFLSSPPRLQKAGADTSIAWYVYASCWDWYRRTAL